MSVFKTRRFVGRTPKWQLPFREVATIQKRLNDATYVVHAPKWKTAKVVHVDKLKLEPTRGKGSPFEADS